MLGALTSNGGVGAWCAGSWPSVARSSPRSRVTTVWGEFPSQVLRATYRVRSRMTSFHIRNPGNSCRSAANSSFTGISPLLAQLPVYGRAVSQRAGIGIAALRSWSRSSPCFDGAGGACLVAVCWLSGIPVPGAAGLPNRVLAGACEQKGCGAHAEVGARAQASAAYWCNPVCSVTMALAGWCVGRTMAGEPLRGW